MYGSINSNINSGYAPPNNYELKYKLEENVQLLKRYKDALEQLLPQIGSHSDSANLRETIKREAAGAYQLLSSLQNNLPTSSPEPTITKLIQDIHSLSKSLGELVRRVKEKEDQHPSPMTPFNPSTSSQQNDIRSIAKQQQIQQMMEMPLEFTEVYTETQIDNRIIDERNKQLHKINKDMKDLRDITIDLSKNVASIDDQLISAEKETSTTSDQTRLILGNIMKGGKYQTAARTKCCIIMGICLCGLIAVVVIIGARVSIYAAMA